MTMFIVSHMFLYSAEIPDTIDNFLKNLGDAFSATALFLLGLSMVGRMQSLKGTKHRMSGPVIVITSKLKLWSSQLPHFIS